MVVCMYYDAPAVSSCIALSMLNSVQDDETALMVAAGKGKVGIVRQLIQHGANVNITNKVTVLHIWCV